MGCYSRKRIKLLQLFANVIYRQPKFVSILPAVIFLPETRLNRSLPLQAFAADYLPAFKMFENGYYNMARSQHPMAHIP
jgi:hypothetical protein